MLSIPYTNVNGTLSISPGFLSFVNTSSSSQGFLVNFNGGGPPPSNSNIYYQVLDWRDGIYSPQGMVLLFQGPIYAKYIAVRIVATDESGFNVSTVSFDQNYGVILPENFKLFTKESPPFVSDVQPSMGLTLMSSRISPDELYLSDCLLTYWGFALVVSIRPITTGTYNGCFFRYLPLKKTQWNNPNWVTKNQIREFGERNIEAVYSTVRLIDIYFGNGKYGQILDESFLGQIFFITDF